MNQYSVTFFRTTFLLNQAGFDRFSEENLNHGNKNIKKHNIQLISSFINNIVLIKVSIRLLIFKTLLLS